MIQPVSLAARPDASELAGLSGDQPSPAQQTSLRFFAISRIVVAGLLVLFAQFSDLGTVFSGADERSHFLLVAQVYVALAVVYLALLPLLRRNFNLQLVVHVMTDLLMLTLLLHLSGGQRSGLGVLIVAAVAGASVLSTTLLAGFFAATAALLVLLESVWQVVGGDAADLTAFFRAGLTGGASFVTAYLVNWLGVRLDRQERLTRQRDIDLHNQLAVTQLVVVELQQGVLVVDEAGMVRTMNRAAQSLLGPLAQPAVSLRAATAIDPAEPVLPWARLGQAFRDWLASGPERPESIELTLGADDRGRANRSIRVRFLSSQQAASGDTVLVLEDLRSIEERAQQLKLASMGRLSASIAHEIRNPLSAIRHANGLLAEHLADPGLQRMSRIVETNTVRIDHIVEDVLSMSRRDPPGQEKIDAQVFLPAFLAEFTHSAGTDPQRVALAVETDSPIVFDANHFRQVLVNILGNGLRYASDKPGAVQLRWLARADDRLELRIADDGPGLTPEVELHLFEPFFTTEARGTGLGLYLARELCQANGAVLRYERGVAGDGAASDGAPVHGAFVIEPRLARLPA